MNRRDFLFLRTTSTGRTLDLSCRTLYMRYVDSALPSVLRQIEDDLKNVDELHVLDAEWLAPTGLSDQIEPLVAAFQARGGRVLGLSLRR